MDAENPFGPFYPPRLQGAIHHAERLAEALAQSVEPAPWIVGRRSEIACVVGHIVAEWRASVLDDEAATRAVIEYLDVLHEGYVANVGLGPPPCCAPDSVTATSPATVVSVPRRAAEASASAATTIDVDPAELLEGLESQPAHG